MTHERGSHLICLMERHASCLTTIDQTNSIPGHPVDLAATIREEKIVRDLIIDWRPSCIPDAETKILYLVGYLATTRSAFDEHTLSRIDRSLAHLR